MPPTRLPLQRWSMYATRPRITGAALEVIGAYGLGEGEALSIFLPFPTCGFPWLRSTGAAVALEGGALVDGTLVSCALCF
ncbi:MAG TPA: hypothetical protein VJ252_02955, partial [Chthoniobacterales bacterium]|nr:hypothetical protein [Chthoniobacterales bacterium]